MIDLRFYRFLGPLSVAALVDGVPGVETVLGDTARLVERPSGLNEADVKALAFFEGKAPPQGIATGAGALLLRPALAEAAPPGRTLILSAAPRAAFARAVSRLVEARPFDDAEDPPVIEPGAKIGPGARIGAGARIGGGTVIGPNAVIGPGVAIGRGARVGPNATVMFALVGDGVNIFAGAVIGEAGFGVAVDKNGTVDVPHFGRVILQDHVTIGANTTVDRGAFDDTVVGEGSKLDDHCHVAHNVAVGRNVIMAAYTGIAGSTTIGDGAVLGARVGVTDHRVIGAGASIAAGSAVLTDVPAGETWAGYPAKPIRTWMREQAWLARAVARRSTSTKDE
jgi:UDP-3-O-[3-hydroxymyristoyl] glucosamine N-acyltransferase